MVLPFFSGKIICPFPFAEKRNKKCNNADEKCNGCKNEGDIKNFIYLVPVGAYIIRKYFHILIILGLHIWFAKLTIKVIFLSTEIRKQHRFVVLLVMFVQKKHGVVIYLVVFIRKEHRF